MDPLAKIERATFTSRQDVDFADKVVHSMVCYFHKEQKPMNSKRLKKAQQEKAGKASVKVEALSKEINHILNSSRDAFLLEKYQKFCKQVQTKNSHHVFKRLLEDANIKTRKDLLLKKIKHVTFDFMGKPVTP